jgi:hypothetical protein
LAVNCIVDLDAVGFRIAAAVGGVGAGVGGKVSQRSAALQGRATKARKPARTNWRIGSLQVSAASISTLASERA